MSLRFFSVFVLILCISCSTTPVKYDEPVKVEDYKYFVRLKEEKDDPVSKKTIGQKVKEVFTKKPIVKIETPKTNKVESKKSRPLLPKRRVRKLNTTPITNEVPVLQKNTRPDKERDIGKSIMLYFIYLQALIILIFAIAILRRQKKVKRVTVKSGELNL